MGARRAWALAASIDASPSTGSPLTANGSDQSARVERSGEDEGRVGATGGKGVELHAEQAARGSRDRSEQQRRGPIERAVDQCRRSIECRRSANACPGVCWFARSRSCEGCPAAWEFICHALSPRRRPAGDAPPVYPCATARHARVPQVAPHLAWSFVRSCSFDFKCPRRLPPSSRVALKSPPSARPSLAGTRCSVVVSSPSWA